MRSIELAGATTHNLKHLGLTVEPGTLVVLTGPSGAGKSSLAFGTLYAEGQRRYVESFSPYARQFLERLARPPVDRLDPVPAAIAIDRRARVKTTRSTVGTLTELSDYARALWVQFATTVCPACGAEISATTPARVASDVLEKAVGTSVTVTYDEPLTGPEHYLVVRERLLGDGYRRLWIKGQARDLDSVPPSEVVTDSEGEDRIAVVLDRLRVGSQARDRLVEAVETAFTRDARGQVRVEPMSAAQGESTADATLRYSHGLRCDGCGYQATAPTPAMFSFNSPIGACDECRGFGQAMQPDWDKVMPDLSQSLADGAIRVWNGKATGFERRMLKRFCERESIPFNVPLGRLTRVQRARLIEGDGGSFRTGYPGLRRWFSWLETKAYKMHVRVLLARYRKYVPCAACGGTRFSNASLSYRVQDHTIADFLALSASEALAFVARLDQTKDSKRAGTARVIAECRARLQTLCDVGLSYVSLDRQARSLSGGELQRVGLTSALGASLSGTLFVLDEPTVGLHPADVERLLPVVRRLAVRDNVVVVVESDASFIAAADRVIAMGPGAGDAGGRIVFDGPPKGLPPRQPPQPPAPLAATQVPAEHTLTLEAASGHNLQHATLAVPLGRLTCVTGVSGSGKSSLVTETLVPALKRQQGDASAAPLPYDGIRGSDRIKRVVVVDQAPLGRTSRGNPATYMGAWDALRRAFSQAPVALERGYKPGFFSFNVPGGRCEACKGEGAETVEMQFLSDVRLSCPECQGRRFTGPVLDVEVAGCTIADTLSMSIRQALSTFSNVPTAQKALASTLRPLEALGLDYLRLGQPLSTLSGGEGQRLRLAAALADTLTSTTGDGCVLFVLDEPTAGLHGSEVEPLLSALRSLTSAGHTVVLVEHDMRVAAACDHIIDLGPGPGAAGGRIVASGTPAEVAGSANSATAPFLRSALGALQDKPGRGRGRGRKDAARQARPKTPKPKRGAQGRQSGDAAVRVRGAREHNLQTVDVDIPREQLVVVAGPSGSGKSTLAFDVIFAESQRRYLETLSPYVRQYLKQLPRPDVDEVIGMPPGISLQQRAYAGARSSTVGTVTEVAHYLRLCFARAGTLHCPDCALPIAPRPAASLAEDLRRTHGHKPVQLLAPIIRGKRGAHRDALARLHTDGFKSAVIDGKTVTLTAGLALDRYAEHDVHVLVAKVRADSTDLPLHVARALELGHGSLMARAGQREFWLSEARACPACGRGFPELDPRFFSFNTRQGACPKCEGRGELEVKPSRGRKPTTMVRCPQCAGARLAGLALHTNLGDWTITELLALSVGAAERALGQLTLTEREATIAEEPLAEARARLAFLDRVGLGYLSLDRGADTLSGGELQRVRLAAQLGSGLSGLLYVLDEPTIGLHPRDTGRLIAALRALVDRGCSVLVVEHDAEVIAAADHMLDVGPSGGRGGGRVLASGAPDTLLEDPASVTGRALAAPMAVPETRRKVGPRSHKEGWLRLSGASHHNLKNVDLAVPIGRLTSVTGVSGSGKSTLVRQVLLPAVRRALKLATEEPGTFKRIEIGNGIRRAVEIDQSPIGRTPRSVPATYVGVWDHIRKLLAGTPQARARGFGAARFSFNTAAGRCSVCEGQGAMSVEMAFLPDALVPCETCSGMRFDDSTLAVTYRGLSAGQLLEQEVSQAAELFASVRKIQRPLSLLCELGLGYLKLGQPSNTLSGGEAQRLKLVSELAATEGTATLYVMDEPTTGLHRTDVLRLCQVIQRLVDRGDTVLVIEHQPDLIMQSDWIVDLGPEGGTDGGRVTAQGTPEDLIGAWKKSHTGKALRALSRR